MTMGGLALFATRAGPMRGTLLKVVARLSPARAPSSSASSHFNYIEFTAAFVPTWIPPNARVLGLGHRARATSPRGSRS